MNAPHPLGSSPFRREVPQACDVLVVGGGINGVGIARDLAGRGLSVLLVEQHDLAEHTSSASTKLIHGGLRYLEFHAFSLVRKALQEREVLLRSAPHIMWPLRFVMPHQPSMRPAWLIRLGLFLYDHLARRELLPASRSLVLKGHPLGVPLQAQHTHGFVYSDGWVDDARLVVLNAMDACERGAQVLTRTRCVSAQRHADHWLVQLQAQGPGQAGGEGARHTVRAKALVNAAGPWAQSFLQHLGPAAGERLSTRSLRLVKGSHIVVPKVFGHQHAYIFQAPDGRIVFAIPYETDFTLIGTTDVEVPTLPDRATISEQEVGYLCEQASRYFREPVRPDQVVWTYSGVRPLLDDTSSNASAVTRDYLLELQRDAAPLLTVWGGKITTFRKLSEEAATRLVEALQVRTATGPWTRSALLPGGDLRPWVPKPMRPDSDFGRFLHQVGLVHPWLPSAMRSRMGRAYGSRIAEVIGQAQSLSDLGAELVPGLHEAEVRHLMVHEWARTAADVLWRRSKLGLRCSAAQAEALQRWMDEALSDALRSGA